MTPDQKKAIRHCSRTLKRSFLGMECKLIFRLIKGSSSPKVVFVDNDVDYYSDDEEQINTVNVTD